MAPKLYRSSMRMPPPAGGVAVIYCSSVPVPPYQVSRVMIWLVHTFYVGHTAMSVQACNTGCFVGE